MKAVAGVIATVGAPGLIPNPLDKKASPKRFEPIPDIAGDGERMAAFFDRVLPKDGTTVFRFPHLKEPTSDDLLRALATELARVDDGDLFVMVLSGHGFSVPLPAPGQVDLPGLHEDDRELFVARDTYVPANELRDLFAAKGDGLTVLQIIDACSGDGIAEVFTLQNGMAVDFDLQYDIAEDLDLSAPAISPQAVSVFDELQGSAIRTPRRGAPTRIKIAAAREYDIAVALESKGFFRGALIDAVIAEWGDGPASYDSWLIDSMKRVVVMARHAKVIVKPPVVRSIGAAPDRVFEPPFTLPGAPPKAK